MDCFLQRCRLNSKVCVRWWYR